ncbi:hypothetical protein Tco_0349272 [Tanacetum coccineum]
MQTPIPTPTRSPKTDLSSDKTTSEELTATVSPTTATTSKDSSISKRKKRSMSYKTKILPGSIAGMCRRLMSEMTFAKTNGMIKEEMQRLVNLTVNKDREVDPINVPELISKEFATHGPKMIEELRTIDQAAGGKLCDKNAQESRALLEDLALYDNERLVANFMASQDARLSKFEADFKQQQGEMTNKINTVLKAINDQITRTLPSDMVKNPKLNVNSTFPVCLLVLTQQKTPNAHPISTTSKEEGKEEKGNPENINTNPPLPLDPSISFITKKVCKLNSLLESLKLVPRSPDTKFVCTKENDGDVMFIEIIKKYDDSSKQELREDESTVKGGLEVEYFDVFTSGSELTYHKYLMCGPIPSLFFRNPIIVEGCPSNLKTPCNIGHVHVEKAYIDLNSPLNVMTRMQYYWIMRKQLEPKEDTEGIRGISKFTRRIKGMHILIGNSTYVSDFMIVEDISSIIDPKLSQVMPYKIEQYNSLSDLEKEHTKSVYLRNNKDKRRGVEYVLNKILGFYKECLELGPEYLTGLEDEGGVT